MICMDSPWQADTLDPSNDGWLEGGNNTVNLSFIFKKHFTKLKKKILFFDKILN